MTEATVIEYPVHAEIEPAEGDVVSCGWQGRAFGAHYPDGVCIDGWLWDLDSSDEPGGGLTSGGDRACPNCNARECVDEMAFSGNARQRRAARKLAILRIQEQAKAETRRWAR
jgi:hypothetical protein